MDKGDIYKEAKITFDGHMGRELVNGPLRVFRMDAASKSIWFVVVIDVASNHNDFSIRISRFGLSSKDAVEYFGKNIQEEFASHSVESIKSRLIVFFIRDEAKPFAPYNFNRGKCLSVIFPEDWIRCAPNETI